MTDPTQFSGSSDKSPDTAQPDRETGTALLEPRQPPAPAANPSRLQVWMHRISVFLFVLVSALAGVLLIILPWTPQWTDNSLLVSYPGLRPVIDHSFFRGMCSGLGMLDIWIAFWEAFHYHEREQL